MTENLEWRDPQAGDVWVKDGEPTVMYVYTGHAWLPTQQTLKETNNAQTKDY